MIPLKIRWVSQSSINVAHDEEALDLMRRSGCQGLLVGFESLNPDNLSRMNKTLQPDERRTRRGLSRTSGVTASAIYGTFIFGYDEDTAETFDTNVEFRQGAGDVHRGVQPRHAVPRDSALRPDEIRGAAAVRRLVARQPLPVQHDPLPAEVDEPRGADPPLHGGARRRFYSWSSIASARARTGSTETAHSCSPTTWRSTPCTAGTSTAVTACRLATRRGTAHCWNLITRRPP